MGNFYVNFTVKTDDAESVVEILRRGDRTAIVISDLAGFAIVADQASDTQESDEIHEVGVLLSVELNVPVFAVLNHDDVILCYWLFENGELSDEYDSDPGYFEGEDLAPGGGDAALLCSLFGRNDAVDQVKKILLDRSSYVFARDRHQCLVQALGLPSEAVGCGYRYLDEGELPENVEPENLLRTDTKSN